MNRLTIPALMGLAGVGIGLSMPERNDADMLYELVREARMDVATLRVQAGLEGESREQRGEHAEGRERRGEHGGRGREGRGEHGEGGREGRGEHGEAGEEGGARLGKDQTWDATRNGAHLVLAYDPGTQSFRGTVRNTTSKPLSQVRVEVHLSNGVELGPTKRVDLKPGAAVAVELAAGGQSFTWWTTHPEHGSEEGHGPGHEGEAGEHGESAGVRPKDPQLRPVHNQLLLLRQDIRVLASDLQRKGR